MFSSVTSVALVGIEARPVRVEVHVSGRRERFTIVGLPDTAVREAKDRVRAAVRSSGFGFPRGTVTVNLAPADLPKAGSAYDLPIALGVLAADGSLEGTTRGIVALGELALDGKVRSARGGLGAGLVARSVDGRCMLPPGSAAEAVLVDGAAVEVVETLADAVALVNGARGPVPVAESSLRPHDGPDLSQVRGQPVARRALEIAAAGGHHLLMWGPPGSGKTLLARCLPGILPPLTDEEALDVAQAWGAAGRTRPDPRRAPFRSPHHSATAAAILGGGSGVPVPGECTLAHHGVLFLDELGEFPTHLLDSLRQPVEEGRVVIARKGAAVSFPCSLQVVAATNPCPCGYRGDDATPCRCSSRAIDRYRSRMSGPLLDRFDLRIPVRRVEPSDLLRPPGEPSAAVEERVAAARCRQRERGVLNRGLDRPRLDGLAWSDASARLLERAVATGSLTARGWDRVRRVARTIADLDGEPVAGEGHVAEALAYRSLP